VNRTSYINSRNRHANGVMAALLAAATLPACSQTRGSAETGALPASRHASSDEIPGMIRVEAGNAEIGFSLEAPRESVAYSSFQITKSPISRGDYDKCIGAGACTPGALRAEFCPKPTGREDEVGPGAEELPMVCATEAQAEKYCTWIGARLPTIEEWLVSARGNTVTRWPWGNRQPGCDEHPLALGSYEACCPKPDCSRVSALAVGRHPGGESPTGLQDVLLSRGELVRGGRGRVGCRHPTCIISGTRPGAIDFSVAPPQSGSPVDQPYSYRCVLSLEARP
jgi:formylglycine-generating enzyme required for sulfatase activity